MEENNFLKICAGKNVKLHGMIYCKTSSIKITEKQLLETLITVESKGKLKIKF